MIYYSCPKKEAKLLDAIKAGFIVKTKGDDGVYTYTLTQRGIQQWAIEKMRFA